MTSEEQLQLQLEVERLLSVASEAIDETFTDGFAIENPSVLAAVVIVAAILASK